jgi:hypothetical protein
MVNNPLKKIKPMMNNHQKLKMNFNTSMMYKFEMLRYGDVDLEYKHSVIQSFRKPGGCTRISRIPGYPLLNACITE